MAGQSVGGVDDIKGQAMDEAPIGVTITDPALDDNPLVYVNDGFVRVTGYQREEILGQNCRFLQGEATEDEPVAAMREAIHNEESVTVELRNYRKDGKLFWNQVSIVPLRDQTGEVCHYVGFQRDISERMQRQTVLEALHEFATVLQTESSVETVCERTVAAAADVLEFDMCTVVLQEGEWLVPSATSKNAPAGGSRRMKLDQGVAGKTFQTGESYVIDEVDFDGDADPAKESYQSGISIPVGEVGVFQVVSVDTGAFDAQDVEFAELLVSHTANAIERIEREAALKRQNERLEEFAGIVSHDLRNPLNVAQLRLELARDEFDSEQLEAVEQAHERMETLIDDVLTLARDGTSVSDREAVSLTAVTESCWQTVETAQATLTTAADREIRADRSRLKQLFENLFRNATKHGGDGVTITVGILDDEAGFYVEDDGVGIPPEEREQVFEIGYSTSVDGTGFGLRIVEQVVEAHGWTIHVTDGPGGARFEITGVEFV